MSDPTKRLSEIECNFVPDLWPDITRRTPRLESEPQPSAMRRVLIIAVAALVVAVGIGLPLKALWPLGDKGKKALPAGTAAQRVVSASPLSPRYDAQAFWVDGRILVMGGADTDPCPPGADCVPPPRPPLRDGAALDPATGRWERITDAPVPLRGISGAVLDDTLYVWAARQSWVPGSRRAFLSYDIRSDRWEELPLPPPRGDANLVLVAAGQYLVAYRSSQESGVLPDLAYDPSTQTWSGLPADPLIPSFDRTMVWTDEGLVLLAIESVPQPGSSKPAFYRAAILDLKSGTWKRLPDSEVVGYDPAWFWSGGRVVNPTMGSSDGGSVNGYGRFLPYGGMLDPGEGTWAPLPEPPGKVKAFLDEAVGGEEYVATFGAILHVPTGTWWTLSPPPDAADEGQAVVWAGDRLFVWGGVRWDGGKPTLLSDGWFWEAP